VPTLDPDLARRRWLDTQMVAFPGEPKRRCDTVAELTSTTGSGPPWAFVLEVEARPRASMLARVIEYEARLLRRLRHGPHRRDRYQVAALVVYLSGRKKPQALRLDATLPGTDLALTAQVGVVRLELHDAANTLRRIGLGELGRCVLPWVPLMAGAASTDVADERARQTRAVLDTERQKEYAGLASVFATWKGHQPTWEPVLKEWGMEKISIVEEWKDKARVEAKRADIQRVLRARFQMEPPEDVRRVIEAAADLNLLDRWIDAAAVIPTMQAFREAIAAT